VTSRNPDFYFDDCEFVCANFNDLSLPGRPAQRVHCNVVTTVVYSVQDNHGKMVEELNPKYISETVVKMLSCAEIFLRANIKYVEVTCFDGMSSIQMYFYTVGYTKAY
jgi:hypothetical protein